MTLQKLKKLAGVSLLCISGAVANGCAIADNKHISDELKADDVYHTMKTVSDWQWQQFNKQTNLFEGYEEGAYMGADQADSHPQGWVYAAFHVGMARWAKLADQQGDESYYQTLYDIGFWARSSTVC